jgi:hypothetical protein
MLNIQSGIRAYDRRRGAQVDYDMALGEKGIMPAGVEIAANRMLSAGHHRHCPEA